MNGRERNLRGKKMRRLLIVLAWLVYGLFAFGMGGIFGAPEYVSGCPEYLKED
jgi:hypothetical protein